MNSINNLGVNEWMNSLTVTRPNVAWGVNRWQEVCQGRETYLYIMFVFLFLQPQRPLEDGRRHDTVSQTRQAKSRFDYLCIYIH